MNETYETVFKLNQPHIMTCLHAKCIIFSHLDQSKMKN